MATVGIIGDTHIPYVHPDYLEFCKESFARWRVDQVVHIGDLVDHHALSFHDSEPSLKSGSGELIDAREILRPWFKAFPRLHLTLGNHDRIPARQMTKIGLDPDDWMMPLSEVYGFPRGWKVCTDVVIDGVLYHHGETANGVNGFRKDAESRMCRTVTGHNHSNAGVSASASDHRLVWGLAVGCGVDAKSMAFAYGKNFLKKPILACGIVQDGSPYVEYMQLGEKA